MTEADLANIGGVGAFAAMFALVARMFLRQGRTYEDVLQAVRLDATAARLEAADVKAELVVVRAELAVARSDRERCHEQMTELSARLDQLKKEQQ